MSNQGNRMPTYAVKIGEIVLKSEAPITQEDRKAALRELRHGGFTYVTKSGLLVKSVPDKD